MAIDANLAIQYGQLVNAAYDVPTSDLTQRAGEKIPAARDPLGWDYSIISTVYGNDLVTDLAPLAGNDIVSYGYVLQDAARNVVIALRGTEHIREWIHDAAFLQKPCPFPPGAGNTEDGFTTVYQTLSVTPDLTNKLTASLAGLPLAQPVASLVICGHSLGGALVTLLALDIASNTTLRPTVYTYASPATGDALFATTYDAAVPNTFRVANQLDVVPTLPLQDALPPLPQYQHVGSATLLNPFSAAQKVVPTPLCEHNLTSYLYLLTGQTGLTIAPANLPQLDPTCVLRFGMMPLLVP